MENIIKVGTKVKYRGCFGMDAPTIVEVTHIERSEYKRDKYGVEVDSVTSMVLRLILFRLQNVSIVCFV